MSKTKKNIKIEKPRTKIKVNVEKGTSTKTEYEFTETFRIGRDEECEVTIKESVVSRFHLEVTFKGGQWWIIDKNSSNGTYINGERIRQIPLLKSTKLEIGVNGPQISLQIKEKTIAKPTLLQEAHSVTQYMRRYFDPSDDENVGEHTMMIRRTFQLVQRKQKWKYVKIIAVIAFLFLITGAYAIYKHKQFNKQKLLAEDIFYNMKTLEIQLAQLEDAVKLSGGAESLKLIERTRKKRIELEDAYNKFVGKLGIYKKGMSEEERLILSITHIFGECEVNIPQDFVNKVKEYIKKWQSTNRYREAIYRAKSNNYVTNIAEELLAQGLPPQFFYLAMQESDFNLDECGPMTRYGIAKGIWQFIPKTAREYGLHTGPLVRVRKPDPLDERHHFEKSTHAAARYLKDIYATKAQASGLLVMASYNWGEEKVIRLINTLPENPRERNFWKLLRTYHDKIPDETYEYVFYIVSAAVIGENPGFFKFNFENPLAEVEKKYGG